MLSDIKKSEHTPLRVLCVFASLDKGGAEAMCINLYRKIEKSKLQFDFVKHTSKECAYEKEILLMGGKIFEAPRYKIYNHFTYCKWWKNHLQNHPEHKIIHGHFHSIASVYLRIAKKFNRITIAHAHSKAAAGILKKLYIKALPNDLDYCFACSKEAGEWMFKNRSFKIIKNAIDVDKFVFNENSRSKIRTTFNITNETIIGTVGRLCKEKNPNKIIEIIKILKSKNMNFKFMWVGGGCLFDSIKETVKKEGLSDYIIFTGIRDDINDLLCAMDIFILPSFWEGLGISLIEAQATNLPCYCSDTIPNETRITDLCCPVSLKNTNLWVEKIMNTPIKERTDVSQTIKDAGYDIETAAKWIENFYFNCKKK